MSVVLGYASTDECILMSDGLAGLKNERGEYAHINEDFKKIKRVNESTIIGWSGNIDLGNAILDFCFPNDNASLLKSFTVEPATQIIRQQVQHVRHLGVRTGYIVAGINRSRQIQINSIDCNGDVNKQIPQNNNAAIVVLSPDDFNAYPIFFTNLSSREKTSVLEAMKHSVYEVSLHSISVNSNIFYDYVRL